MALKGTIKGRVTNLSKYFSFYLTWSATQDIAGNYSDVTVNEWIETSDRGQTFDTVAARDHSITIDGGKASYISKRINCNPWDDNPLLIHSYTKRVYHEDDGSKSIVISGRSNGHALSWGYSSSTADSADATASGEIVLDTIPRASDFGKITGNTIGSPITINIDRKSDAFTHSLWYSFGDKTWHGIAGGVGTSKSFTPPMDLCKQIPNDTQGQMTLILRTYNSDGKTPVGNDVYEKINVNVPSSVIPTIGGVTATELIADIANKAGVFIQSLSKLKISIDNAKGVYDSTIESYKISFDGTSYSKQTSETAYINGSGTLKINAEVTDSRGRKGTFADEINVVPYSPPKFTVTPSAERQETATDVLTITSASATSVKNGNVEKNFLKLYILYKKTFVSYFPSLSDTYLVKTTGLSFSEITKILTNIDEKSSYDIRVLLVDNFKQVYWDLELGTEIVVGDLNPLGWGIGKYHEKGMLDVAGDIYMNDKKVAYADHQHEQYLTSLPNHSHSTLSDRTNGTAIYLNYGASGISNPSWFAAWNGYELRAISPDNTLASLTTKMTQNVLWSGGLYMTSGHTATLSQSVSAQRNGIVLIFSKYNGSAATNQHFHSYFVPKQNISTISSSYGQTFHLSDVVAYEVGFKTLYIHDTKIVGVAENDDSTSSYAASGIKYVNSSWVLRYVIGV